MKLYGSTTSPFVRRTRIFTHSIAIEFISMDIFAEGRDCLREKNPTLKVPFLIDDDKSIYDSRVIYRYLVDKFELSAPSIEQENILTMIDAASDSLVSILLLGRSGFDTNEDKLFFNLQHERINQVFKALQQECQVGSFKEWHYPSICLYCLLDWVLFRDLLKLSEYPELIAFHGLHQEREEVKATDPRVC